MLRRPAILGRLARGGVLLALLVIPPFTIGCTVEPRADTRTRDENGAVVSPVEEPGADSAAVLQVVDAFHDALRVGDVARVAALSVPGTTIVDQEDGVRWRLGGNDARLPSPLDAGPGSGGLTWQVAERSVRVAGEARVVTLRWQAIIAGEPVEWWGVESVVLVPTDEGWRLTHVHRSRGGDPTPGPGGAAEDP